MRIQPPFSSPQGFTSALSPQEDGDALWFIFSGAQLLVSLDKKRVPQEPLFSPKRSVYLGTLNHTHLFALDIEGDLQAPKGWQWSSLRHLYGAMCNEQYAIAGQAVQLLHWDRTHTFCGCCGSNTFVRESERCRECPLCGHLSYPTLAPAIVALVKKKEKILLARSPHFPEALYSVIAGFVDPGETLEQCAAREVLEEVGVKVKNVRYFGSQPWPLSHSLMVAFTCDWQEGEIKPDPSEISDAAWFDPNDLPKLPPLYSISRTLIDSCLQEASRVPKY